MDEKPDPGLKVVGFAQLSPGDLMLMFDDGSLWHRHNLEWKSVWVPRRPAASKKAASKKLPRVSSRK